MNNNGLIEVRTTIENQKRSLLTALASIGFLCVVLMTALISVSVYTVDQMQEREAVSMALDDQRLQYFRCVEDNICSEDLVSPPSREIRRNIESVGFAELLYKGTDDNDDYAAPDNVDQIGFKETFGVLGYIIHGK